MNHLEEFQELKRLVVEKQSQADKAAGALEEILKRLRKEFKCKTLKEAKARLAELTETEEKLKKRFESRLGKFKKKYGKFLGES